MPVLEDEMEKAVKKRKTKAERAKAAEQERWVQAARLIREATLPHHPLKPHVAMVVLERPGRANRILKIEGDVAKTPDALLRRMTDFCAQLELALTDGDDLELFMLDPLVVAQHTVRKIDWRALLIGVGTK